MPRVPGSGVGCQIEAYPLRPNAASSFGPSRAAWTMPGNVEGILFLHGEALAILYVQLC